MSSEPLNPSSGSPRNSTSPTNRRVSFADDGMPGGSNRHGSFDTDPASASPQHKRISFADSLDDDFSRPGSMFSHGRRGQPGSRSQMSRTCSLDVDFVDDNATAWPRSFQRASSYFAGTALLLTPAQAIQHDTASTVRRRAKHLGRGWATPDDRPLDPDRPQGQPPKLAKKSLTTGDEHTHYRANFPPSAFRRVGAAHQAPLSRAQSYDSEDGDEFDDVDYAQLEEAQAAAAAANQSEQSGHHSTASNLQALFNAINVLLGVGVLSVPYAVAQAGWSGVVILAVLALITNYTGKLIWDLQRGELPEPVKILSPLAAGVDGKLNHTLQNPTDSKDTDGGTPMQKEEDIIVLQCASYPDIGQLAYGRCGRSVVGAVLYAELFCTLVLFIIMLGTNLVILLPNAGLTDIEFMAIAALVLMPVCWLRSMAVLSWFSSIGVASSVSLVISILAFSFLGSCDGGDNCSSVRHPNPAAVNVSNPETFLRPQLPLSIGLLIFCFSGHSVFPEVFSSMRRPQDGPKVLNQTYGFVVVLYIFIAICGFLWLGSDAPEQITQGLPPGWVSMAVTWLLCLSTYTKFALEFNPIAAAFEELLPCFRNPGLRKKQAAQAAAAKANADLISQKHNSDGDDDAIGAQKCCANPSPGVIAIVQVLLRSLLVIVALGVAVSIPCFGPWGSLIGALLAMAISVGLPSWLYLKVRWARLSGIVIAVNIGIIVVAIFAAAIGSYSAILEVVQCLEPAPLPVGNVTSMAP